MPFHRAVSPLALEISQPRDSDFDDCPLAGSDDELTESQRSAQSRRAEKLGEAYLQGTPLFILSASLRGPLDKGWVNPWKKDRTKATANGRKRSKEQPVIPETNSRKRRQYNSPSVVSRSKLSGTPQEPSQVNRARENAPKTSSADQVHASDPTESTQSPRFTRHQDTDVKWLKKGKVSTRFRNVDPPTSPTTSLSSRHLRKAPASDSQSTSRLGSAGYESAVSSQNRPGDKLQQIEPTAGVELETKDSQADMGHQTPGSMAQKGGSQSANGTGSVHVVSSSSQLPKFEYRVKQRRKSVVKAEHRRSLDVTENESSEVRATGANHSPKEAFEGPSQGLPPARSVTLDQEESNVQKDVEDPTAFANNSISLGNTSSTSMEKGPARNTANDPTDDSNLPAAQKAPEKPPSDNITSLHSIAVSKATSNRTHDHSADQQLSTQAALMMAQKSFQNDLQSPEPSRVSSNKKPRMSHSSSRQSPSAVNITPFHKVNNADRDMTGMSGTQQNDVAPMVSTQYMIDTATPFTFSTEKKAEFRMLSSEGNKSKSKKRKTTSFALSSPSEIPSERFASDDEETENVLQGQPPERPESQQSVLPLTLTGTTPPTAQEGQGAESFDLSQAIAEAGSWLQQSFEINRDITHCGTAKGAQSYSVGSNHPADS